jgi:ABC-type amino acid transport substrate-binding protein
MSNIANGKLLDTGQELDLESKAISNTNKLSLNLVERIDDIVDAIASQQVSTSEDIVAMFGGNIQQATKLLLSKEVRALVIERSNANLFIAQHTKALPKLIKLLDSENEKIQLSAITTLAKLNGDLDSPTVNVNLNLENLLSQTEKEIKDSPTVEIEFTKLTKLEDLV